jgi:hypothetical protein
VSKGYFGDATAAWEQARREMLSVFNVSYVTDRSLSRSTNQASAGPCQTKRAYNVHPQRPFWLVMASRLEPLV